MTWNKTDDKLPEHNQVCWVLMDQGSLFCIVGPIVYKQEGKCWLDFVGGEAIPHEQGIYWAEEGDIVPPSLEEE